jgi:hypothetical protein
VVSAGCIGGQTGNATGPPQENGSTPTEGAGNDPATADGERKAVRFIKTDEEPANHSTVLEQDELNTE